MASHEECRIIPSSAEELFDLVAEIESYPEFLPWCIDAYIRSRTQSEAIADLVIGFRQLRESFTSRVNFKRPQEITMSQEAGPFSYLIGSWQFKQVPEGCQVYFRIDFAFRSKLLEMLMGRMFSKAVRHLILAFEARAHDLHHSKSSKREA